jgi:hypothetical protein
MISTLEICCTRSQELAQNTKSQIDIFRRKKDIVTTQALAAAMVNPHNVYNDTGLYTPPDGRYLFLV